MDFKDNVVILTGASTGIGEAMAYELAGQGAWLALAARNTVRLEEVAAACRARGGRALVVATDVTDEEQCRELVEQTVAHGLVGRPAENVLKSKVFPIPGHPWCVPRAQCSVQLRHSPLAALTPSRSAP